MGSATSGAVTESPPAWPLPPTPKRSQRARSSTVGSSDWESSKHSNPREETYHQAHQDGKHTYTYVHIASSHSPHFSPRERTKSLPHGKVPRSPRSCTSLASLRSDQIKPVAHSEPHEKVQEEGVKEQPGEAKSAVPIPVHFVPDEPNPPEVPIKIKKLTTETDSTFSSTDQVNLSTGPSEVEPEPQSESDAAVAAATSPAAPNQAEPETFMAQIGSARDVPSTLTSEAQSVEQQQVDTPHDLPVVPEESPKVGSVPLLAQAEPVVVPPVVSESQRASTPPQADHSPIVYSPPNSKRSPNALSKVPVPSSPHARSSVSSSPPVHPLGNPLGVPRYPSTHTSMIAPPTVQSVPQAHPQPPPRRASMPPPQSSHDLALNRGNAISGGGLALDSPPSSLPRNVPSKLRSRSSKIFTFRHHDSEPSSFPHTEATPQTDPLSVEEPIQKTLKRRQSSLTKRASTLFHLVTHKKSPSENEPALSRDARSKLHSAQHRMPHGPAFSSANEPSPMSGIKPPSTRPRAATYQSHSSYASADTHQSDNSRMGSPFYSEHDEPPPPASPSKSTERTVHKISTEPFQLKSSLDTDHHPDESAKHGLGSRLRRLSFKKKRTSPHLDTTHAPSLPDLVNGVPKH